MSIRKWIGKAWPLAAGALLVAAACEDKARIKTEEDRLAYAIGYGMGKNIERTLAANDDDPSLEHMLAGVRAALQGSSDVLTEEEIQSILEQHSNSIEERRREEAVAQAEENLKTGNAYLEGNKDRAGVNVLPSGVQYRVLEEGDGIRPTMNDTVLAHYLGRFVDGEEFEGTYAEDEPIYFPIQRVIPGWQEVLQLMPVGSKWEVTIPSELAYGERGTPNIPPNSTLVFEVELLGIKGKTIDIEE